MRCLNFFGDGGACPPFAETKKGLNLTINIAVSILFFNTNSLRAMLTQNTYIDKRTIEGLTVGTYIITFG